MIVFINIIYTIFVNDIYIHNNIHSNIHSNFYNMIDQQIE